MPLATLKRLMLKEPEIKEWGLEISMSDIDDCQTIADVIRRLHELYAASQHKSSWGQKTPRFVRWLELLAHNFPDARFVHLVRDPRAVARSLIRSNAHSSDAYHAALRWNMDVGSALRFEELHPDRILRITYEHMIVESESVIRAITEFLGASFDPSMLIFQDDGLRDYSPFYAQMHKNLDRPLTSDLSHQWQKELSPSELALIEHINYDQMELLGYKPVTGRECSLNISRPASRLSRCIGISHQAFHYLRYRRKYLFHLLYRKWRLGFLREFLGMINY